MMRDKVLNRLFRIQDLPSLFLEQYEPDSCSVEKIDHQKFTSYQSQRITPDESSHRSYRRIFIIGSEF